MGLDESGDAEFRDQLMLLGSPFLQLQGNAGENVFYPELNRDRHPFRLVERKSPEAQFKT